MRGRPSMTTLWAPLQGLADLVELDLERAGDHPDLAAPDHGRHARGHHGRLVVHRLAHADQEAHRVGGVVASSSRRSPGSAPGRPRRPGRSPGTGSTSLPQPGSTAADRRDLARVAAGLRGRRSVRTAVRTSPGCASTGADRGPAHVPGAPHHDRDGRPVSGKVERVLVLHRARVERFGEVRDVCQDSPVALAGCRGASHCLTPESRLLRIEVLACVRTEPGGPISPVFAPGATTTSHGSRSELHTVPVFLASATRPTAGVGAGCGGEQRSRTPAQTQTRQQTRRTRETYGGTEDPHQAQGL